MQGLAPGRQRRRGLRDAAVERVLPAGQVLAAGLVGLADARDRLLGAPVVVEVLVGQHAQGAHEVLADDARLLDLVQHRVGGEQLRQPVHAVDGDRAQPAEVVEAHVVVGHAVGLQRDAEHPRHPPHQPDGRVADADDAVAEELAHRLRDDASRVGEVDGPRIGRDLRDGARHLAHHGDRAQRVGQAARPDRLLAEQPEVEGHPLVRDPPLGASDPDRGEDEVGAGQRLAQVDGVGHPRRVREAARVLVEDPPHGLQTLRGRVVQHHLVEPDGRPALGGQCVRGDRLVDQRHAETAAAENRELHGPRTYPVRAHFPRARRAR